MSVSRTSRSLNENPWLQCSKKNLSGRKAVTSASAMMSIKDLWLPSAPSQAPVGRPTPRAFTTQLFTVCAIKTIADTIIITHIYATKEYTPYSWLTVLPMKLSPSMGTTGSQKANGEVCVSCPYMNPLLGPTTPLPPSPAAGRKNRV